MAKLARFIDGIPVVANNAERAVLIPQPAVNQRVQNLAAGAIQRWNGAVWVTDFVQADFSQYARLSGQDIYASQAGSQTFVFTAVDAYISAGLQGILGPNPKITVLAGGDGMYFAQFGVHAVAGTFDWLEGRLLVTRVGPMVWDNVAAPIKVESFDPTKSPSEYNVTVEGLVPLFEGDSIAASFQHKETGAVTRAFNGTLSLVRVAPLS